LQLGNLLAVKSLAKRFFRSPWSSTIITLLVIVVGGIGAVYPDEIKKGFPFHLQPMPLEAQLFWSLTLITSIAFFFRQREDDAGKEASQERVLERARELEHLVRTLPPANFLSIFATLYDQADAMETLALGTPGASPDPSVLEPSMRTVLRLIATLAQEFDGGYRDVRYAANIMLFKSSANMAAQDKVQIAKRLKFCDDATALDNLKGVLDLDIALSTVANDESVGIDPHLEPIAIPIPKKSKTSNGRYKILPGAPHAFVDKEADLYVDALMLAKWCDDFGDFTIEVKRELQEYFTAQKKVIRSFISIPIFLRRDDGTDALEEDPIAVLNIHCSKENLLKEVGEPLKHFVSIVRPMQIILAKMVMARVASPASPAPQNDLAKQSTPAKVST
jgi:hypothetical protein